MAALRRPRPPPGRSGPCGRTAEHRLPSRGRHALGHDGLRRQPHHPDAAPGRTGEGRHALSRTPSSRRPSAPRAARRSSRVCTNGRTATPSARSPITPEHVAISYPVLLRKAGYRTGFVGKFGVGVPAGRTKEMFDSFTPLEPHAVLEEATRRHASSTSPTSRARQRSTSSTRAKPDEPFCLSVSFNAPHAEDNDPKQYFWQKEVDDLYRDAMFPVPKTMTDEFFNSHPEFLRKTESRVRFNWRFDDPEEVSGDGRGLLPDDLGRGPRRGPHPRRAAKRRGSPRTPSSSSPRTTATSSASAASRTSGTSTSTPFACR